MKSAPGSGNAAEKVLMIIEALPDHGTVSGLANFTGLPKSTVHRILQTLVTHDFALDLSGGRYVTGPRVLSLAGRVMSQSTPLHHVDPILHRLQQETQLTVHLGLLVGDEAMYVAKTEGPKPYQMPSRLGMSIRLHTTAIGKAILAAMSDTQIRDFARRARLERRTPNSITRQDALVRHLQEVRAQGYAIDNEENETGIWCLGAAVHDYTGRTIAAVSASTLTFEKAGLDVDVLARQVTAAAAEISTALGG